MARSVRQVVGMYTPWGTASSITDIGNGIKNVTTPSHGGYFVPNAKLASIPEEHQAVAASWSGSRNWYEEDCCWAYVCLAFPELFPAEALQAAQLIAPHITPGRKAPCG